MDITSTTPQPASASIPLLTTAAPPAPSTARNTGSGASHATPATHDFAGALQQADGAQQSHKPKPREDAQADEPEAAAQRPAAEHRPKIRSERKPSAKGHDDAPAAGANPPPDGKSLPPKAAKPVGNAEEGADPTPAVEEEPDAPASAALTTPPGLVPSNALAALSNPAPDLATVAAAPAVGAAAAAARVSAAVPVVAAVSAAAPAPAVAAVPAPAQPAAAPAIAAVTLPAAAAALALASVKPATEGRKSPAPAAATALPAAAVAAAAPPSAAAADIMALPAATAAPQDPLQALLPTARGEIDGVQASPPKLPAAVPLVAPVAAPPSAAGDAPPTAAFTGALAAALDARAADALPDAARSAPADVPPVAIPPAVSTAAAPAAAADPPPVFKLNHGLDTPEFPQALSDRVAWLVDKDIGSAKLSINPPQLGPIDVHIEVSGDKAQIFLSAHSVVTRETLEAASPRLRDMLGAQGFTQVNVDVSQRSFQDRGAPPARQEWTPLPREIAAEATFSNEALRARRANPGALDAYA